MRVNIKISVERKVEEDLCIYSYSDKKSYDVLSGKYSGLSRLFPTSGDYLVKIDFDASLQLVDAFGGFAYAHKEQSRCKRVERSGVADFEFLESKGAADVSFDFVHRLEGGPLARFVNREDDALEQFFLCHQSMGRTMAKTPTMAQ